MLRGRSCSICEVCECHFAVGDSTRPMIMNLWFLLTVFLATAVAQNVTVPLMCSENYVYYYKTTENSSVVTCMDVPIEHFCIPAQVIDAESFVLSLTNCSTQTTDWIPTELFHQNNRIRKLIVYAHSSNNHSIQSLNRDTFKNLQALEELTLEGFERIHSVDPDVFQPLVHLQKLNLIGFGAQFLTYSQLGDALYGLSNSSLEEITLRKIHTSYNKEKVLDLNKLFRISGVNITSLVLIENDFNQVTGILSSVLPSLKYLEVSMYWLTYASISFGIDAAIFLEHLEEINYSFITSRQDRGKFLPEASAVIDVLLSVFNPDILKYYFSLESSPNCYFNKVLRWGPNLKRVVLRNMDLFSAKPNYDICFDGSTQIEYIDLLQSPFGTVPRTFRGTKKMTFFNLQETGINSTSYSMFHEMPNLEVLLLGRNNIGSSIAADLEGTLFKFQNRSLRTLDLSECGVTWIPSSMFSALSALQFLNLSRNRIETFETKLHPIGNLSLLNLSENSIRMLSAEMIDELEAIQRTNRNNKDLTIDLTRNPLSCLCNATNFVVWLKSTKKVFLENVDEYICLHPNASQISISRLDVPELLSDCETLSQLVNTTCPCEGLNYTRLQQIALSLTDVYCTYEDKRFSYSDLVANTNKKLQEYWWCKNVINKKNPFYMSPKFIGPVTVGIVLLLLLAIALIVIYKKRYTPADIARSIQRNDMRRYIMHLIQYLSNHPANSSNHYEFDVLVYFQDDDEPWVRRILLEKLKLLSIMTPDDFQIGALTVDAILDGCTKCRVIVLVLSLSFKNDQWCREATLRAYTSFPGSVIPVFINNTDVYDFNDDPLLANLIATHYPTDLSTADDRIWDEFIARVYGIISIVDNSTHI